MLLQANPIALGRCACGVIGAACVLLKADSGVSFEKHYGVLTLFRIYTVVFGSEFGAFTVKTRKNWDYTVDFSPFETRFTVKTRKKQNHTVNRGVNRQKNYGVMGKKPDYTVNARF